MTSAQEAMLDNMIQGLKLKCWADEKTVRAIRAAAEEYPVIPPPIAEANLRSLLGKNDLPIIAPRL